MQIEAVYETVGKPTVEASQIFLDGSGSLVDGQNAGYAYPEKYILSLLGWLSGWVVELLGNIFQIKILQILDYC